jgi:indole-3-glycerol phosphate synthase
VGTFLESVVERTQADLSRRKRATPAADLEARLGPARRGRPFSEALIDEGISLIAEMKRASPSKGPIRPGASVAEIVAAYQAAGARAVSVLTEQAHFGGSLDDLAAAREACDLPLLRKDFLIDPYQVLEARVAGADAVLLIAEILDDPTFLCLLREVRALGMQALVEVHEADSLRRVLRHPVPLIGINNRDLKTFKTDLNQTIELARQAPSHVWLVSESGIHAHADLVRLKEAGVRSVLVGETLMRAADIGRKLDELRGRS